MGVGVFSWRVEVAKSVGTKKRELQVRWDRTASRWLKRNEIPHGSALVLQREADNRKVRGDTIIHRHRLPAAAPDTETVAGALRALEETLITDIKARRQRLRLYAPDGSIIDGRTHLGNVRSLTPKPTEEDKQLKADFDWEIYLFSLSVCEMIDEAEDDLVPIHGFVRGLLTRISLPLLSKVIEEEVAGFRSPQ